MTCQAVQANQFLALSRWFPPQNLSYLLASHADPDIIAALDRWLSSTRAKLAISRIRERFAPHFTEAGKTEDRVIGGRIQVGGW
jgi:flavorubredoxin